MHPTLETIALDNLLLCSTGSPKHLIFLSPVLQASAWCHLSEVPPSITFRSLSHLFFDGRKEKCHRCICSSFLCLPASLNYAMFCIPCAELAGRGERGAKQLYGSIAYQKESKQIGSAAAPWPVSWYFPISLSVRNLIKFMMDTPEGVVSAWEQKEQAKRLLVRTHQGKLLSPTRSPNLSL